MTKGSKKILHVLYSGLGGHGNVFFSLLDADKNRDYEYEVIFFGVEEVRDDYIQRANASGVKWSYVKKNPGVDLRSYRQIIKLIKQSRPHIIFLHSSAYIIPAAAASIGMRNRGYIVVRETQANHLKSNSEWIGIRMAMFAAHKIVFLSTEYREEVRKKIGFLFKGRKTAVIPNGIDLDAYKPSEKGNNNAILIGMQSRLTANKDHKTLIRAMGLLLANKMISAQIKLVIAGDGEYMMKLQELVNELKLNEHVTFLGMLNENALPDFINSLDIYVHATLGETMSTAIMQVMACRKPVIASDVKGVNNMVQHNNNGLLVPAEDPAKLAEAIRYLVQDGDASYTLAEAGYQTAVEKFSNQRMFKNYIQLFEELPSR